MILDDMSKPNEGYPHGVPSSYDWYSGSTSRDLTALTATELATYHALNQWGVLYEDASINQAVNTWVKIRDLTMYYYSGSS